MQKLMAYCAEKNHMRQIFGQELLDAHNPAQAQTIANQLDSDLSPENLCCDGELPMREVRRKSKLYNAAAKELRELYPAVEMYEA